MSNFDDFVTNVKGCASAVGEKVSDGIDFAKLNTYKVRIQSDIKKDYAALGEKYYLALKNKREEDFSAEIQRIDDLKGQLDSIIEQINIHKKLVQCSSCSQYVPKGSEFCPHCGNKIK